MERRIVSFFIRYLLSSLVFGKKGEDEEILFLLGEGRRAAGGVESVYSIWLCFGSSVAVLYGILDINV